MSFYQYAPRQVAPRECRSIGYTVDSLLLLINVIEEGLPAVIPDGRYSLAPKPVVKIIMSKPPKHDLNQANYTKHHPPEHNTRSSVIKPSKFMLDSSKKSTEAQPSPTWIHSRSGFHRSNGCHIWTTSLYSINVCDWLSVILQVSQSESGIPESRPDPLPRRSLTLAHAQQQLLSADNI